MVHTWIMDVTPLQDDMIYRKCYNRLPDWRREKADRIRPLEGKMQSAGAWILYQQMLKYYELSDQMPYNLSHSGKYALCSVSTQPDAQVGCDVEMIKENKLRLAERYFCPGEVAWIQSQTTEAEQAEGFYRYWVLKESFIKATREGMAMGLDFRKNTIIRSIGRTLEMPELPYAVQKRNLVNFIILTNEISFDKILYGKNMGLSRNL